MNGPDRHRGRDRPACRQNQQLGWRSGVNQLAAQASQPLIEAAARARVPADALRCVAGAAGCSLAGDVPSAGLAATRVGPDMAVIQVLAGRPW
jgi:hypothetical protein